MQFEKRNFMGVELDVLTGHPEHDLLFVATQVARAAGLKNPKGSVQYVKSAAGNLQAKELKVQEFCTLEILKAAAGRRWADAWMFPETTVYKMLLRGHAPASEPFRKWVTEEVLPSIRRTGVYKAEESTNPIAQGVMDELKTLRGEVGELKTLLQTLANRSRVIESAQEVSVYLDAEVHTERVWRHFDRAMLIKLCEMKSLSAPVADRLKAAVMLNLEAAMITLWNAIDPRKLHTELSRVNKRPWSLFPLGFLKKHMNQSAYAAALEKALNDRLLK